MVLVEPIPFAISWMERNAPGPALVMVSKIPIVIAAFTTNNLFMPAKRLLTNSELACCSSSSESTSYAPPPHLRASPSTSNSISFFM